MPEDNNPYFGFYKKAPVPDGMGKYQQQAYALSGVGSMPNAFGPAGPYGEPQNPGGPGDVLPPAPGGGVTPTERDNFLTNSFRDYAALARRAGYSGIKAYEEAARVIPQVFQRFVNEGKLPAEFAVPTSEYLMGLHDPDINLGQYALSESGQPLRHGSTWKDDYFLKHWTGEQPSSSQPVPNDYLLPPQVAQGINRVLPQAAGARRPSGIFGAQQYLGNLSPEQIRQFFF